MVIMGLAPLDWYPLSDLIQRFPMYDSASIQVAGAIIGGWSIVEDERIFV
jgi:hypothetical protein